MIDFLKFVTEKLFSFATVIILLISGFAFFLYVVIQSDIEVREKNRQFTEFCYSKGLVPITTDAGRRCADPRSLVAPK